MKHFLIAAALLAATSASAATLGKDAFACVSKSQLDEFYTLLTSDDTRGASYMLGKSCLQTNKAVRVSILKQYWGDTRKVRIYNDGGAAVVWVKARHITN
jgi:hypothetical protein